MFLTWFWFILGQKSLTMGLVGRGAEPGVVSVTHTKAKRTAALAQPTRALSSGQHTKAGTAPAHTQARAAALTHAAAHAAPLPHTGKGGRAQASPASAARKAMASFPSPPPPRAAPSHSPAALQP